MILKADQLPLATDDAGTIRVANTRISLDVLMGFYNQGQSADDLHHAFPALSLADIHSVIGYYLRHRGSVDEYLSTRRAAADELRAKIEAMPGQKEFRERLIAQKAAVQATNGESQST